MTFFWLPPPFRENSRKFRTFSIGRLPLAAWCRCGCLAGWPRARCWSGPPSAASTRPYQGTSSRCVGSRCGRQSEECDWEFRPLFSPHHPPGQDLLEVQCRCPCHLMPYRHSERLKECVICDWPPSLMQDVEFQRITRCPVLVCALTEHFSVTPFFFWQVPSL